METYDSGDDADIRAGVEYVMEAEETDYRVRCTCPLVLVIFLAALLTALIVALFRDPESEVLTRII